MNYEQSWTDGTGSHEPDLAETRAKRRRILIVSAVLIAVVIALAVGYRLAHKTKSTTAQAAPTVTVVIPGRTAVTASVSSVGTLAAKRMMPVGVAGEGGEVSRVLVDAGDWVRKGETLATVDPAVQAAQTSQMQAQIASAQANAKLAQAQLDRAQALVSRGFISKSDVDQRIATRDAANASVKLAEAQYREQSARLGRLDIRAPAAGFVLSRAVEAGQVVSSGSNALFTIAQDGMFEFDARLAEQDLAGVRLGQPVTVTPVGSGQSFTGAVWQISPTIDTTSRQGLVRVQLPYNAALRPGGFASASFSAAQTMAPLLPESAVLADTKGQNYVYVITAENKVERRDVKVGDVSDKGIAIASGLSGTEQVVYSAGAFLNVGDKVVPDLKKTLR
jgi:HlyD family secretion protein